MFYRLLLAYAPLRKALLAVGRQPVLFYCVAYCYIAPLVENATRGLIVFLARV